jgi:hypothetical protein
MISASIRPCLPAIHRGTAMSFGTGASMMLNPSLRGTSRAPAAFEHNNREVK